MVIVVIICEGARVAPPPPPHNPALTAGQADDRALPRLEEAWWSLRAVVLYYSE